MKNNIERMDDDCPDAIRRIFELPYHFFSNHFHKDTDATLLDIASGEAAHHNILAQKFKNIIHMDIDFESDIVQKGSILNIPLADKYVDATFCFETIEHLAKEDQLSALWELERVTDDVIIIGTIDEKGQDYFEGHEIFKAINGKNPHHLAELDSYAFKELIDTAFPSAVINYMSSRIQKGKLNIYPHLTVHPLSYCNYAIIQI